MGFLEGGVGDQSLVDICFTQTVRRAHHDHALAVVGADSAELVRHLDSFLAGKRDRERCCWGRRPRERPAPLCFAFGDSTGWPDMGRQLLDHEIVFADALTLCDSVLRPQLGFSVMEEFAAGADPISQPALRFALEVALVELWRRLGVRPDVSAGEGAGMLAAAYTSGELSVGDAGRRITGQCSTPLATKAIDLAGRPATVLASELGWSAILKTGRRAREHPAGDVPILESLRQGRDERRTLLQTVGALWIDGHSLNLRALFPAGAQVANLPRTAWQHRPMVIERPARAFSAARFAVVAPDTQSPGVEADLLTAIRERAAALLVLTSEELDPARPLSQFGIDSLTALELQAAVVRDLGVEIPLAPLAQGASLGQVIALARNMASTIEIGDGSHSAHEPFPLTAIQHAYWVGRTDDFDLGGVSCHLYLELESRSFNFERFTAALNRLIERHEMLRAVIEHDGRQRVLAQVPRYEPEIVDLRAKEDAAAELERLREACSHEMIPSDRWPLFKYRVVLLGGGLARILVSLDLLVADAASVFLLADELNRLYENPDAQLDPVAVTFRDYVLAEQALDGDEARRRDWNYWSARVDALPAAPKLPLLDMRAKQGAPRFRRRSVTLDATQWSALRERAAANALTPSGLLCSAFAEVIRRFSGGGPFTLNLTTYNRLPLHPDIARVVGDFTSLIPLEVDGEGDTFGSRAARLQAQLWRDLEHRRVNGVEVMRKLAGRHGASRAALPVVFTSTLGLEAGGAGVPFAGLGELVYTVSQTPQVWLDHQVLEREGELELNWDAVEALFPSGLLDAMIGCYKDLLERLARGEAWEERVPVGVPADQAETVRRANATDAPTAAGLLHEPFLEHAAVSPDSVAIVAGERRLTYGELERRSGGVAAAVSGRGELVAISMRKGWEQVVATLGVLRAGAAYVPIDPELPAERLSLLIGRVGARVVLTQPDLTHEVAWPANVEVIGVAENGPVGEAPSSRATPTELAYVIFTSGSTGEPKGVMVEHRAALNTISDVNRRFALGPDDRVLALSALSFDLSVWDIFGTLAAGARIVMPDPAGIRDPAHWQALLGQESVSVWNSVPALMTLLLERAAQRGERLADALRLVMLSGDWIPITLPGELAARSRAQLISLGGATEAAIWSIFHRVERVEDGWTSVPYGRPLSNQRFHVLGADLEPCPVWATGELYIGGEGLALGYWKDHERTAAAFIVHPRTRERLYRTGDLGRRRPDGVIEFQGRVDAQVKVHGYRIELGEVETALTRHPQVQMAVCAALGPREERRLAAYYTTDSEPPEPATLRAFLATTLPHWMLPASYTPLPEIPLSPNGKVDRDRLPDPAAVHASRSAHASASGRLSELVRAAWSAEDDGLALAPSALQRVHQEAQRELGKAVTREDTLAAALTERLRDRVCGLLDLQMGALSADEPLNTIGLDSLKAVELSAAMERDLGLRLPLSMVTEGRSLAEVTARLAPNLAAKLALTGPEVPVMTDGAHNAVLESRPGERYEPFELNAIQQAYWVGRSTAYDLGGVSCHAYFEIDARDLVVDRFADALNAVIARHDMLRAVVEADGRQRVLRRVARYEPQLIDLRDTPDAAGELERLREELSHQVLAANRWPLFEFRVVLLAGGRARILLSLDLLVADGASLFLFAAELGRLYRDPDTPLEPIAVTFRDYLLTEQKLNSDEARRLDWDYWLARLDRLPDAPRLPLAGDPRELGIPRFRRHNATLEAPKWLALREHAAQRGITRSALLCAVFAEVLGRFSGDVPFTLNLTTYSRLAVHPDIAKVIGDFTSLVLLEVTRDASTFHARASDLQAQLWRDLEHRRVNGVEVMREIARRRGHARAAMPVVFTSTLGLDSTAGEDFPLDPLGELVYAISQTPQVWLDHQVLERNGALHITWDIVERLFPDGLPEGMIACYLDLLTRLARGEAWDDHEPVHVPAEHADAVRCASETHTQPTKRDRVTERDIEHATHQDERFDEMIARLAELVATALGREAVDPRASLDDLGATSIDVLRLHPRICAELGADLPLRDLVTSASLRDLAEKASLVAR